MLKDWIYIKRGKFYHEGGEEEINCNDMIKTSQRTVRTSLGIKPGRTITPDGLTNGPGLTKDVSSWCGTIISLPLRY